MTWILRPLISTKSDPLAMLSWTVFSVSSCSQQLIEIGYLDPGAGFHFAVIGLYLAKQNF